jgi:hypothetical protein
MLFQRLKNIYVILRHLVFVDIFDYQLRQSTNSTQFTHTNMHVMHD